MKCIWYIYKIEGTNYIGSTTDLHHRQNQHQTTCFNTNDRCHTYPVYKYIREQTDITTIKLIVLDWKYCFKHNALLLENEYIKKYDSIKNGQNGQLAYLSNEDRLKYARERAKAMYELKKDEINLKRGEKIQCPICLVEHNKGGKARHNKRIHFTHPPTETREEYLKRIEEEKEDKKTKRKAYMKKLNAERKYKPKQECMYCNKKYAHGTLNQHYKYCKSIAVST